MKKKILLTSIGFLVLLAVVGALGYPFSGKAAETSKEVFPSAAEVPVKGMPTMIDLGANSCIPCKMMAPIMEKVEKAYKAKAAIIFIDVWKNKEQAKRFGIRAIPTQIFFDKDGKEVYRHVGFMSEEAIRAQLKKMGVN